MSVRVHVCESLYFCVKLIPIVRSLWYSLVLESVSMCSRQLVHRFNFNMICSCLMTLCILDNMRDFVLGFVVSTWAVCGEDQGWNGIVEDRRRGSWGSGEWRTATESWRSDQVWLQLRMWFLKYAFKYNTNIKQQQWRVEINCEYWGTICDSY